MTLVRKATFFAVLAVMTCLSSEKALAACSSTVNGRPMSVQLCNVTTRVYGRVSPGHYRMDNRGNWFNIYNPRHRGNIFRDAERSVPYGGNNPGADRRPTDDPPILIDPSSGCEGGSCVNIIW